ncbi:hypothetical protein, partial [Mycobacterium kansasii]|uniref:hypothetical protein n=2 Tax=Mycobacterium kansasii TaxID=1768 RepID=UPI001CA48771
AFLGLTALTRQPPTTANLTDIHVTAGAAAARCHVDADTATAATRTRRQRPGSWSRGRRFKRRSRRHQ